MINFKDTLEKEMAVLRAHAHALRNSIAQIELVLEEEDEGCYPPALMFTRLYLLGLLTAQEASFDTEYPDLTVTELFLQYTKPVTEELGFSPRSDKPASRLILPQ